MFKVCEFSNGSYYVGTEFGEPVNIGRGHVTYKLKTDAEDTKNLMNVAYCYGQDDIRNGIKQLLNISDPAE